MAVRAVRIEAARILVSIPSGGLNEEAAEKVLRQASKIAPKNADVHHALDLSYRGQVLAGRVICSAFVIFPRRYGPVSHSFGQRQVA